MGKERNEIRTFGDLLFEYTVIQYSIQSERRAGCEANVRLDEAKLQTLYSNYGTYNIEKCAKYLDKLQRFGVDMYHRMELPFRVNVVCEYIKQLQELNAELEKEL